MEHRARHLRLNLMRLRFCDVTNTLHTFTWPRGIDSDLSLARALIFMRVEETYRIDISDRFPDHLANRFTIFPPLFRIVVGALYGDYSNIDTISKCLLK